MVVSTESDGTASHTKQVNSLVKGVSDVGKPQRHQDTVKTAVLFCSLGLYHSMMMPNPL